jgi:hypothetical protein
LKKITSAFLSVLFIFGQTLYIAADSDTRNSGGNTVQLEAGAVLSALGLFEFEDENENISNAEFAVMTARLFGLEDINYNNSKSHFKDVLKTTPGFSAINSLADMGIIRVESENFFPNRAVLYQDATATLLRALGYEAECEYNGGFPAGYMHYAKRLNLSGGISLRGDSPLTNQTTALLFYNLLEINIKKPVRYMDGVEYKQESDYNILSEYFDIHTVKGVVTANEDTSVYGVSTLGKGVVEINEALYRVGSSEAHNYLGYNVKCYIYNPNDDMGEILYIHKRTSFNEEIRIDARDIAEISESHIDYYDGQRRAKIKWDSNIYEIYNGKIKDFDAGDLDIKEGNLIFLDNNRDGVYELVFVEDYSFIKITSINTFHYTITGDDGTELTLAPNDSSIKYAIIYNNTKIGFSDLKIDNVLSIMKSDNADGVTLYKIYVSDKTVKGEIEEITEGKSIILNGTEYILSEYCTDDVSLNINLLLYLDVNGKVFRVEEAGSGTAYSYGYIYALGESTGVEKLLELKIMDEKGIFEIYRVAKNLNFNSDIRSYVSPSTIKETLESNPEGFRQLIKFRLDKDKRINELYTSNYLEGLMGVTDRKTRYYQIQQRAFLAGNLSTDPIEFYLKNDTLVFYVGTPTDQSAAEDEALYRVSNLGSVSRTNNVRAYGVDDDNVVDICVIYDSMSDITIGEQANNLIIVNSLSEGISINGDVVKYLNYYQQSALKKVAMDMDNINLRKGDVLVLKQDKNNIVKNYGFIQQVTNFQNKQLGYLTSTGGIVAGKVTSINAEYITVSGENRTSAPTTFRFRIPAHIPFITIYDSENDKLLLDSNVSDIPVDCNIVLRITNYSINEIVAYI